jgi:hypothetical protein
MLVAEHQGGDQAWMIADAFSSRGASAMARRTTPPRRPAC